MTRGSVDLLTRVGVATAPPLEGELHASAPKSCLSDTQWASVADVGAPVVAARPEMTALCPRVVVVFSKKCCHDPFPPMVFPPLSVDVFLLAGAVVGVCTAYPIPRPVPMAAELPHQGRPGRRRFALSGSPGVVVATRERYFAGGELVPVEPRTGDPIHALRHVFGRRPARGCSGPPSWPGYGVIFGAHLILFSKDAEADRSFLADVLGFDSVDAGGGWLTSNCLRRKLRSIRTSPLGRPST